MFFYSPISLKEIGPGIKEKLVFKDFSIFNSGGHFVHRSGTILAPLVEGHLSNISMKFE